MLQPLTSTPHMAHVKNRFEYYGEQRAEGWVWFYRPIGTPVFINFPGRKDHLLALLARPAVAVRQYSDMLYKLADIVAARTILNVAEQAQARCQAEAYAKDASTPVKAARAAREFFASLRGLERARARLERATTLSEQLTAQPFDPDAWLASHFGQKT